MKDIPKEGKGGWSGLVTDINIALTLYTWNWGITLLYGLHRHVRPQRVWFFSSFDHK